jgi:hypothetical protein
MTKRLSNADKVFNLQKRIDNHVKVYDGTIVKVDYDVDFREIVLTGDGFLALKGIMSEDGTKIKITKSPGWMRSVERKPPVGGNPDRDPAICDMCIAQPISFAMFESICKRYKKAWTHVSNV